MTMGIGTDALFAGSIPQQYEQLLVPMLFEPYARDMAERVVARSPLRVLELAAGTGVLTRELASRLSADATIVASDLNVPMLELAAARGTARPVEWRQVDAMQLPFDDAMFDAVVCQFGVMFFPDKVTAFGEARRVLAPGGALLFNTWDRIEENAFTHVVETALAGFFTVDPPRFMSRIPHGYHDIAAIRRDLAGAGFASAPAIETLAFPSRGASARMTAVAICQATPLRNEIEALGATRLDEATDVATRAIAREFGSGPVEGTIQAHVVSVER
jgi:SAM-dependent methyltransferase